MAMMLQVSSTRLARVAGAALLLAGLAAATPLGQQVNRQLATPRPSRAAVRSFADPARDRWQRPGVVLDSLGLRVSDRVAVLQTTPGDDTGYWAARLARRVYQGFVYSVTPGENEARRLAGRVRQARLRNVRVTSALPGGNLLPEPVDVLLCVNSYSQMPNRVETFHNLGSSLLPGGHVAVIDWKRGASALSAPQVEQEMNQAGYRLVRSVSLPRQSFLIFKTTLGGAATPL